MRVELHCHTTQSDGTLSQAELTAAAAERMLALWAITDHDASTVASLPGATCVRGVELTCSDRGRHVHMLIFDAGGDWSVMERELAGLAAKRLGRMQTMCAKLERRGIRLDADALCAAAIGRSVGRPDLARAMVAAGYVRTVDDAFRAHLYDGGPVDVPHQTVSPTDGVALAMRAGAVAALAHPHQLEQRAEPLCKELRPLGLTGLEVDYGRYDASRRAHFRQLAERYDLVATAGSDFHTPGDPPLGIDVTAERMQELRAWLRIAA